MSSVRTVQVELPRPHPAQQQVIDEARRFNVVCCGRRWGKTTLGIDRLVQPALQGDPVAWFSPTYKMLTETWREIRRTLRPLTERVSEQEHRIELVGGGIVEMWSLDSPDSARGRGYQRIVIDEAAMVAVLEEAWQAVIRPTLTDHQGDAWFLSTPRGMNYFHALFERPQQDGSWASWRMPSSSNPYLPPDELEAARRDVGPLVYLQEYEADFTALGEAAFPEFSRETHVIPTDLELVRYWRKIAGHDWGYAAPAATLWFAIDPKGGAVAYREWSARHLQPDEVAQGVLYRQPGEQVLVYADPSMWGRQSAYLTQDQLATLRDAGKLTLTQAKQYEEAGLSLTAANNARIPGKLRLHTMFSRRPTDGVPYLRFMDCCEDTIATFQNLQLDPDRTEDVLSTYPSADPVWRRDEYYDCARYAMIGVPRQAVPDGPRERRAPRYFEANPALRRR